MRIVFLFLLSVVSVLADDFVVPFKDPLPGQKSLTIQLPQKQEPAKVVKQPQPDIVGKQPPPAEPVPQDRLAAAKPNPISNKISSPREQYSLMAKDLYSLLQTYPELLIKDPGNKSICEIRYFTLYDVEPTRREEVRDALFFWVNSLSSRNAKIRRPELVPDSEGLLYRIYLSHYNWTPEAWEKVVATDHTFQLPWIDRNDYAYVFALCGNALLKASWFIDATSDTSRNPSYYSLIYADVEITRNGKKVALKGEPPVNEVEFNEAWFVDLKTVEKFKIDRGAVIPDGTSLVAWNNRHLWRVPTLFGYYWKTFDVFEENNRKRTDDRDFLENRFPKKWDASEYIVSMPNGLQAYLLSDGAGKRVEFADPRVASEAQSALSRHSVTVRTSQSCVVCHNTGILHFREFIPEVLKGGVELKVKTKAEQERIEEYFLSDVAKIVDEDGYKFAKAVAYCNGRTHKDNSRIFANTINWYRDRVTVEQAARDCGVTVETMKAAFSFSGKGRLAAMATQGLEIPRWMWDQLHFPEAMLLIENWKKPR